MTEPTDEDSTVVKQTKRLTILTPEVMKKDARDFRYGEVKKELRKRQKLEKIWLMPIPE